MDRLLKKNFSKWPLVLNCSASYPKLRKSWLLKDAAEVLNTSVRSLPRNALHSLKEFTNSGNKLNKRAAICRPEIFRMFTN
jgi:hypothetical protein